MSETEQIQDPLVNGRTYLVKWDDCCVQGAFKATLISHTEYEAAFGNGVWLDSLWGYTIEEV